MADGEPFDIDAEIIQRIEEQMGEFLATVDGVCEEHIRTHGNEIYVRRLAQVYRLTDVADDIEAVSRHLRNLVISVAVLPTRELEGRLKLFARTRGFRCMSQLLHSLADNVETIEDEWNDMPALPAEGAAAASGTAAASGPMPTPTAFTEVVAQFSSKSATPPNTRRKGVV